jgi:biopolymer transport protein ExbD
MKLNLRRATLLRDSSLVSMGDIAFQLIVFFMVTTTFMRDSTQVDLPRLPLSDKTESPISVAIDAGGKLHLDGQPVDTSGSLESQLRTLLDGRSSAEERQVRFRCAASLTQKDYRSAMEAISNAGGVIAVMHDPEGTP